MTAPDFSGAGIKLITMKKLLIISLSIIIVILLAILSCFYFYNSEEYKLNKIKKILDVDYVVEERDYPDDDRHITKINEFTIYCKVYSSGNCGSYYLDIREKSVKFEDYIDVIFKSINETYKLPSKNIKNLNDFLDFMYLKDKDFKDLVDKYYRIKNR